MKRNIFVLIITELNFKDYSVMPNLKIHLSKHPHIDPSILCSFLPYYYLLINNSETLRVVALLC